MIEQCESLLKTLDETSTELSSAMADFLADRQRLKDAESDLAAAENEVIAEAAIKAKIEKEGPLAGLAVSSPAYKSVIESIVIDARRNELSDLVAVVQGLRAVALESQIAKEQLTIRFSATKHAAELRSAMLKATV